MRKLEVKLIWAIVRPFLAVPLLLVLSATFCKCQGDCFNAQNFEGQYLPITPGLWAPGQSYVVTVTAPSLPIFEPPPLPITAKVVTEADFAAVVEQGIGWFSEDPSVGAGPVAGSAEFVQFKLCGS